MRARSRKESLRTRWDTLRTSFWLVPSLMAVAATGLAAVSPLVDGWFGTGSDESMPWFVYVGAPGEARELLSTLLASMMTMTSLVFSITMVVLTLAANQFGPRLIRNFMSSAQTQLVLGTFVMTIVYCLLALSSVGWREGEGPFAYMSVSAAIVLALVSIALLVAHIHGLGRSIMSETLVERVGCELDDLIGELHPLDSRANDDPESALPDDFDTGATFLGTARSGYVQAIEFDDIIEAAREADVLVGLYFRAGDFVVEGGGGIGIYPRERSKPEVCETVRRAVVIGVHRTPVQDPDFSIRHLVEIAVRALSPGINDPYTAVAAVARLSASLSRLMGRALPQGVFVDEEGTVRIICPRPTYTSILAAAFDQIRQAGSDKPIILIHLIQAINRMAPHARTSEQIEALQAQVKLFLATAERSIADPSDILVVKRKVEEGRKALERAAGATDP